MRTDVLETEPTPTIGGEFYVDENAVDPFAQPDMLAFEASLEERYADDLEHADSSVAQEVYGHSLGAIRRWGRQLLRDEIEAFPEVKNLERVNYDDFKTKVIEMIKTDIDFREHLDVETRNKFELQDGKPVWADGTPFSDMLDRGLQSAREAAQKDPCLYAEAERSEGDLEVSKVVEGLKTDEAYLAISMEPKRELDKYPKLYEGKGYRKGVAYVQWYSKKDEQTLVAGSYSIDLSDEERWRQVGASYGMDIPAGESPNRYIRHGVKLQATPDEAQAVVRDMRADYYEASSSSGRRFSINEYVEANEVMLENIFDSYYGQIARAVHSARNDRTLQRFAAEILDSPPQNMKPELIRELQYIARSSRFTDSFGRILDDTLCYAAVENLRGGIKRLVKGESLVAIAHDTRLQQHEYDSLSPEAHMAELNRNLVGGIYDGVGAGRNYDHCGGGVSMSSKDSLADKANQQGVFGGRGEPGSELARNNNEKEEWEYKIGYCVVPNCPRGEKPAKVGPCGVCEKCEHLDNEGANLKTYYSETPKRSEPEQRKFDKLFISIANAELERESTDIAENEVEIAPHVDAVFEEVKQRELSDDERTEPGEFNE